MKAREQSITTGAELAKRDCLVLAHLDLVFEIAGKIHANLPSCFDLDDLVQAGRLGLMDAATRFDPIRFPGVPFGAYARKRIRGAIVESIGLTNSNARARVSRMNTWNESTRPPIEECNEERHDVPMRETPDTQARTESMIERTEIREYLNELLAELPPRQAVVIKLHTSKTST